jgi:hypothetical protein
MELINLTASAELKPAPGAGPEIQTPVELAGEVCAEHPNRLSTATSQLSSLKNKTHQSIKNKTHQSLPT